ncbi:MAG: hypothetical protein HXY53_00710 [Nitrospirae bacterium]|nr:hypothetical protein [Nitrospirota bacterium]
MKDRIVVVSFILVFLFFTISGCAKKEVIRQPESVPPLPEKITPYTLIERITSPEIKTLQGSIKLNIFQNGESKGTFSGVLLYEYPYRMRIKVFGPLWFTLAELLFDHGLFQVLIPLKDSIYSDNVPFKSLFPDRNKLEKSINFIEETDEHYVLYIVDFEYNKTEMLEQSNNPNIILKAKYSFQKSDLFLESVNLYRKSKKNFGIRIHRTKEKAPSEILINFSKTLLSITLNDIEINKPLKKDIFKPLEASQNFPLSEFLKDFAPSL